MRYCALSTREKRYPEICSNNRHENAAHPDRVLDVHDLIYLIDGEWEIAQDDEVYHIAGGDLLFLSGGHRHYGVSRCRGLIHTMYVHFPRMAADVCTDHYALEKERFVFPAKLHIPANSAIPSLFERLIESYWTNAAYSSELASAYLSLMLTEMSILAGQNEAVSMKADAADVVNRLIKDMDSYPSQFLSINAMCERANVSRKTLYNYFMQVTACSPYDYQIQSKLEKARELIRSDPGVTLRWLASHFGFCDEYHFSRLYKAKYGHSPKQKK